VSSDCIQARVRTAKSVLWSYVGLVAVIIDANDNHTCPGGS
jgi:hypothetical protein